MANLPICGCYRQEFNFNLLSVYTLMLATYLAWFMPKRGQDKEAAFTILVDCPRDITNIAQCPAARNDVLE